MEKLRREITQNIHHELRTPLVNVMMPLELAITNKFEDPEQKLRFVKMAISNLEYLDSLVTDIVMPGEDGLEVIKELREAGFDLPILVMSGGIATLRTPILAAASALGADEVITKPFRPQALREQAEGLLKRAAARTVGKTA